MASPSRPLTEARPLEPELHEGDRPIPAWLWVVVGGIVLFAAFVAPFQLFWPVA